MNQNNFPNTVGHFLDHRHWVQALQLLKFQLKAKKKNKHFNTLEMFYYEKFEASFAELESEEYFKNKVANNLFYGLNKEFAVIPYTIPKSNLGLRQYKFMTCPLRILYYAIGLYLLELSQEYLQDRKPHKHIDANYGGNLFFDENQELNLKLNHIFYKPHYKQFRKSLRQEIKDNTERKVVIKLDIENYFDELSIPKLLHLLKKRVKPSIRQKMRYKAKTRAQLVSFFDFVMGRTSGIPQSDNNIISSFIGYLFLVFGDLFLNDELRKYDDLVDDYKIIRYVDDIYVSITFKEQSSDWFGIQSMGLRRKVLNSLAPRISDRLYEKLGIRLNPNKTRLYQLDNEDDKEALERNLKKVSQGFEIADEENNEPPTDKIENIFKQLEKLKHSASPYFQEHAELDEEMLKEVYDEKVQQVLEKPDNKDRLKEIFMDSFNFGFMGFDGFDFELVNADPSPIIILILACDDVSQEFEKFLLSKKNLTSRDVYLILSYLRQIEFKHDKLLDLLKQNPQMKEVMEIFEAGGVLPKSPSYGGLTEEQTLEIAQPHIIEQIRLRRSHERKEEYSVALNHLLNEIQAICFVLDDPVENEDKYKAPAVLKFLDHQKVSDETRTQIQNLFDQRNETPVSHPKRTASAVTKKKYLNYRSHVRDCLKHLGENCSLKSS